MAWLKLEDTFHDHYKPQRLAKALGCSHLEACGALACLWSWAVGHKPDGDLDGMLDDEIASAAKWVGDATVFVKALRASKLLDKTILHDWWERAESHKAAQRLKKHRDTKRVHENNDDCNVAETLHGNATETLRGERGERGAEQRGERKTIVVPKLKTEVDAVVEHYRKHHPQARPGKKERDKIKERLVDKFSVGDLCEAIDGCHKTPHNLGENERGEKYLSLELIVRTASQVTRFIENNRNPPKPKPKGWAAELKTWNQRDMVGDGSIFDPNEHKRIAAERNAKLLGAKSNDA
jgi:hypothetical protein